MRISFTILLMLPMILGLVPLAVAGPATATPAPTAMQGAGAGEWKDYKASDQGANPGQKQEIPSGTLVVAAYIIIWAVVLIYVLLLALRQKRLTSELQQLRQRLDALEPHAEKGADEQS